jgi:hypothetical protein
MKKTKMAPKEKEVTIPRRMAPLAVTKKPSKKGKSIY